MSDVIRDYLPAIQFSSDEANLAHREWGCNCGPGALAAVLEISLDQVRPAVEAIGFAAKRYVSPTMMRQAIPLAGGRIIRRNVVGVRSQRSFPQNGLARIQWTGPWTAAGANPRWAYRQTHWVATWRIGGGLGGWTLIFDINAGLQRLTDWEKQTVPRILTECVPRNDGGWFVTDSWEVQSR